MRALLNVNVHKKYKIRCIIKLREVLNMKTTIKKVA